MGFESKEERVEVKTKKGKDARERTEWKDERRYNLSGAEPALKVLLNYS